MYMRSWVILTPLVQQYQFILNALNDKVVYEIIITVAKLLAIFGYSERIKIVISKGSEKCSQVNLENHER